MRVVPDSFSSPTPPPHPPQLVNNARGVALTLSLFEGETFFRVAMDVGAIDVSNGKGQEIILRLTTDLASNGTWWTDNNGVQAQQRWRNFHPTYPVQIYEPVASNFYPATAFGLLQDVKDQRQLVVVSDRPHGVSSLNDGQLELMVHRRIAQSCHCDNGYQLDTNVNVRVQLRLALTRQSAASVYRPLQADVDHPPQLWFSSSQFAAQPPLWTSPAFDDRLRLLTYQLLARQRLLVRLQHAFLPGEDAAGSQNVSVNLQQLVPYAALASLQSVTETNLVGTVAIAAVAVQQPVVLAAGDIRTFVFQF